MKSYFLNIPNEERQNILDQHKSVYDGYVTNYGSSPQQPLLVQDFANDKGGITVNNKGEVKPYTNIKINENVDEMELDMIGDGPMDFEAGVMDDEMTEGGRKHGGEDVMPKYRLGALKSLLRQAIKDDSPQKYIDDLQSKIDRLENNMSKDESNEEVTEDEIKMDVETEKEPFEIDVDFYDELEGDDEMNESVKSQVNESLNWFKRFSKYN
jgi:hypothetical protein